MSTKLRSNLKLLEKVASLTKSNSHIQNKSKIKVQTTIQLDSPGILLKGWFK